MDKKGHIFDWYSRCYGSFGGVGFLYARKSRTVNVFAKEASHAWCEASFAINFAMVLFPLPAGPSTATAYTDIIFLLSLFNIRS